MFVHFDKSVNYSIVELQNVLFEIKIDVNRMEKTFKDCIVTDCTIFPYMKVQLSDLRIEKCTAYKHFLHLINEKD